MKKLLICILFTLLCAAMFTLSECEMSFESDDLYEGEFAYEEEYEAGLFADLEAADALCQPLEDEIHRYDTILHGGTLDRAEVNPNFGTYESGDFIALVYMEYPLISDPASDRSAIVTASNTVARATVDSVPGVAELAVFWELPAYESQAKIQFLIEDGEFRYGDAMLPRVMVE